MKLRQHVVIVGAGPAGLAPLFAAANANLLARLLETGVTVVERTTAVGAGQIGNYGVSSDSSAQAFLDILSKSEDAHLSSLYSTEAGEELMHLEKNSVPLKAVGKFLDAAGSLLCRRVQQSERGRVMTGWTAVHVQRSSEGLWTTRVVHSETGEICDLESRFVLIASGGYQPMSRLHDDAVAGVPLLPRYEHKVLQSDVVLRQDGLSRVRPFLEGARSPKVVIVGGSTSAGTAALRLLYRMPEVEFGPGGVTLMHRRPLRIFYESAQHALDEQYTDFTAEDICALTGSVHRLAGFRLETRELLMRVLGVGGRAPEPRLSLLPLREECFPVARKLLDEADLIVAAVGYRPRLLPVLDENMQPTELIEPSDERWSVVDNSSRLLTKAGHPLEGLSALGLAVGPGADSSRGGERGFVGQVNSLWLWQHTLGRNLVNQWLAS